MSRKITISGPFTDADIKYLLQAVRNCEQKQPDKEFSCTIEGDKTVQDARKTILENFPWIDDAEMHLEIYQKNPNPHEARN